MTHHDIYKKLSQIFSETYPKYSCQIFVYKINIDNVKQQIFICLNFFVVSTDLQ